MELIDREKIEWYGCNFETPECESENRKCSECSHAECSHAQVMQLPSIKVPDNATNCVVVNLYYEGTEEYAGSWIRFDLDWWNAPYKNESENK